MNSTQCGICLTSWFGHPGSGCPKCCPKNDPTFTKSDTGKLQMALIPFEALEEVAAVLTHGATKYTPNNWTKGCDWSRYLGACLRHIVAWGAGREKDPETGLSHLAHAVACLLFLISLQKWGRGTDDRVKIGAAT